MTILTYLMRLIILARTAY
ncbi:hypothetical protein Gotur_030883 [Gossypium turneri]